MKSQYTKQKIANPAFATGQRFYAKRIPKDAAEKNKSKSTTTKTKPKTIHTRAKKRNS